MATARDQLERLMARAALVGRGLTVISQLTNVAGRRAQYRRKGWMIIAAGVIVAETTWVMNRVLRRGSHHDSTLGWVDNLTSASLSLLEMLAGLSSQQPDSRPMHDYGFYASAESALAFADTRSTAVGTAIPAFASVFAARATERLHPDLPSPTGLTSVAMTYFLQAIPARVFMESARAQADALDDARRLEVDRRAQLATEGERQRQYRIIHDSALQILEAVAGGWDIDDGLLLRRIDFEIRRLSRRLDVATLGDDDSLPEALAVLVEEFALLELEVTLDTSQAESQAIRGPIAVALADATHEALMNVHKHARARTASVRARPCPDGGIEVLIQDRGCGFDPQATSTGFGLAESIQARLRDIGGHSEVHSAPGRGTSVLLRGPK